MTEASDQNRPESYPHDSPQATAPFLSEAYLVTSPYQYPNFQPYPPTTQPNQVPYLPHPYPNYYPAPYQECPTKLPALAHVNPYVQRNPFIPPFEINYAESLQRNCLAAYSRPQVRLPPPHSPRPPQVELPQPPAPAENPEKPHACGQPGCNLRFRRIEHARRHRDGVHFKLKPYACPYPTCGKKFARSDNLRQHIKSIHRKLSNASV
ncbi:hypothetical protein L0F63_003547 [Massospora cicadina]|nr:hypothetical protein L0F63_003547 [Massospora cicadina]